jgi:hypothetical protein
MKDLGKCRLCNLVPEYRESGYGEAMVPLVIHQCPELTGSPRIVFSVEEWLRGVDPYDCDSSVCIGKDLEDTEVTRSETPTAKRIERELKAALLRAEYWEEAIEYLIESYCDQGLTSKSSTLRDLSHEIIKLHEERPR